MFESFGKVNMTEFIEVAKKAILLFESHIQENSKTPPVRAVMKQKFIEYKVLLNSSQSTTNSEIAEEPDWSGIIYEFVEKHISNLSEFQSLVNRVAHKYKKNIKEIAHSANEIKQVDSWMKNFLRAILFSKIQGVLTDSSLIEDCALLKSELELSPYEYYYKYYLDCLLVHQERIDINQTTILRKVRLDDLEETVDIFHGFWTRRPEHGSPRSILEFEITTKDEKESHLYIERIFAGMRLFKAASIHALDFSKTKKTIMWPRGVMSSGGRAAHWAGKRYELAQEDIPLFVSFINRIEEKHRFDPQQKEFRSLAISLERYNNALLESVDIDRRNMTAVMGIESMLTLEHERGENAFKLAMRAAKLLGKVGFNAIEVRKNIGDAYKFRNLIVHGGFINNEDKGKINILFDEIINYLRVSLILFILIDPTGKNKVIDLLDSANIDTAKDVELSNLIEGSIGQFKTIVQKI